jgi:hypothetical protein
VIVFERRASVVLYRLLRARPDGTPVLLPANVCAVVVATLRAVARPFRLVDVTWPGLGMDKGACLEIARQERLGGVIFVHPYGAIDDQAPGFFAALRERQPDLMLVDDRCLCVPDLDGTSASGADATLYSTGYGKYLDLGGGGFAYLAPGTPYAAVEPVTLELALSVGAGEPDTLPLAPPETRWEAHRDRARVALPPMRAHKQRLNAIYRRLLPATAVLPDAWQQWRFNVLVDEPDRLLRRLFAAGLFASRHYPPAVAAAAAHCPVAARLHERVVNLFNDGHYDEEQATRTALVVGAHLAEEARRRSSISCTTSEPAPE